VNYWAWEKSKTGEAVQYVPISNIRVSQLDDWKLNNAGKIINL
jgi:hypothetical protein